MNFSSGRDSEVTELLQQLIRNACVNDGSPAGGREIANARTLEQFLAMPDLDVMVYEPRPGRASVVARLIGTDKAAPTLVLLGHTDVVPASSDGWDHDPFGGDHVDGWIWGRGAIDMLGLTASMAAAIRRAATLGRRRRGSLIFVGVADEEAGGLLGTKWLLDHHEEAVTGDAVITEWGGVPVATPAGTRLWVSAGEKGRYHLRLVIHGTPGHSSRPYGSDNAIETASEVILRLSQAKGLVAMDHLWFQWVDGMGYSREVGDALRDPFRVGEAVKHLPGLLAQHAFSSTHMTTAPTTVHGGSTNNVIPHKVELDLDVRTLYGQSSSEVVNYLMDALGSLSTRVSATIVQGAPATRSPTDNAIWQSIEKAARRMRPHATCIPTVTTGRTDARFFRAHGIPAYGFGLFSDRLSLDDVLAMFHGRNERIDEESLELSTRLWVALSDEFLS